jgi:hypothetical protein
MPPDIRHAYLHPIRFTTAYQEATGRSMMMSA